MTLQDLRGGINQRTPYKCRTGIRVKLPPPTCFHWEKDGGLCIFYCAPQTRTNFTVKDSGVELEYLKWVPQVTVRRIEINIVGQVVLLQCTAAKANQCVTSHESLSLDSHCHALQLHKHLFVCFKLKVDPGGTTVVFLQLWQELLSFWILLLSKRAYLPGDRSPFLQTRIPPDYCWSDHRRIIYETRV